MDNKRISELDALRGIAAFTVLISHCIAVYPVVYDVFSSRIILPTNATLNYFTFSPLHIFWNGHAAVILFFILSGFVLSVSHYDGHKFDYGSYLVKRICRLYIPYFVIVTVSVLLLNFYQGPHGLDNVSYPFNESWSSGISIKDYLKLLLLHGKVNVVDFPLWTIIIEIEVSIILPFFIMMIKKLSLFKNILFIILYMVALKIILHKSEFSSISDLKNLYFLPFFLFGSILYKYRLEIKELKINNTFILAGIYALILILCNWEWVIVWFIKYNKNSFFFLINDYVIAIGCILLIIICVANISSIKKILNKRVFQFLGKISYSLYLIHVVVILFILYSFRTTKYDYLVFFIFASALLISYVYYLGIEQPSIKLGKYLALSFKERKAKKLNNSK